MDTIGSYGLAAGLGMPMLMPASHQHHDVELNYVEHGAVTYLFNGAATRIAEGQLTLFWAAIPHQIITIEPSSVYRWLTVPFVTFLHWQLSEPLVTALLHGAIAHSANTEASDYDAALFRRWHNDLHGHSAEYTRIVQLEIEARLRRLALAPDLLAHVVPPARLLESDSHTECMASFIAEHYTEPLQIADIAAGVGLHPTYAMTLFRQRFHTSLGQYLIQHRLAHAQRLLVTTSLSILDVALESGFGSLSRFYAVFKAQYGCAPAAYRAALRFYTNPG